MDIKVQVPQMLHRCCLTPFWLLPQKHHILRGLTNKNNVFPSVLKAGRPRSGRLLMNCVVRAHSWGKGPCRCVLPRTQGKMGKQAPSDPFTEGTGPVQWLHPHDLITSPNAPPFNSIALGVTVSVYEFGRDAFRQQQRLTYVYPGTWVKFSLSWDEWRVNITVS